MNAKNGALVITCAVALGIVIVLIGIIALTTMGKSINYHDQVSGELVNASVNALPHSGPYTNNNVYLSLPGGSGTYCVVARTTTRGSPAADIAYSYSFDRVTTTSDKFGSYNTTETWETGCGGAFPMCIGYLGRTDDNGDVDRIFSIPSTATASRVIVTNTGTTPAPSTKVDVVIRKCEEPPLPAAPAPGTMVKCSDWKKILDVYNNGGGYRVEYQGANGMLGEYYPDGTTDTALDNPVNVSRFHPGGYFTTMSTKLGSYNIPANLTVVNKSTNTCEVAP